MADVWIPPRWNGEEFIEGFYAGGNPESKETQPTMVPDKTAEEIEAEAKRAKETEDARKAKDGHTDPNVERFEAKARKAEDEAIAERKKRQEIQTELDEAKKKLKDADDADLKRKGDLEQLVKKREEELEAAKRSETQKTTALERRIIKSELKAAATAAGIIDPRDVDLADAKDVKFDGDDVVGVKEAIDALKKDRPHLFQKPDGKSKDGKGDKGDKDGDKSRTSSPGTSTGDGDGKKSAMDMTDEEFADARKKSKVWAGVQVA